MLVCTNNIKIENNELEKVGIKNPACCHFDKIIKIEDFDFDNILLEKKSCENILIYDVSHKALVSTKPLHIMFDKVDMFIRDYDGPKYLVLFNPEKYNSIYDKIRYLMGLKSSITYFFSHNYSKIKIGLDDDLLLGKTLTLHNVTILSKPVFIEDQNHYYYNVLLEKSPYQLAKNELQQIFLII